MTSRPIKPPSAPPPPSPDEPMALHATLTPGWAEMAVWQPDAQPLSHRGVVHRWRRWLTQFKRS